MPTPGPRSPSSPRTSWGTPGVCLPASPWVPAPHLPLRRLSCPPRAFVRPSPAQLWELLPLRGRRGDREGLGCPKDVLRSEPLGRRFAGLWSILPRFQLWFYFPLHDESQLLPFSFVVRKPGHKASTLVRNNSVIPHPLLCQRPLTWPTGRRRFPPSSAQGKKSLSTRPFFCLKKENENTDVSRGPLVLITLVLLIHLNKLRLWEWGRRNEVCSLKV